MNYAALLPDEKTGMLLKVKQAARRGDELALTPDQKNKIDNDIRQLAQRGKR